MNQKLIAVLFAALVAFSLVWSTTHRDKLVLQAWCQENGLHIKAVHLNLVWNGGLLHGGPFHRNTRGNIYRFEAVRDGETGSHVYWAIITRWRGEMEVAVEAPGQRYVRVGTGHFPREVF